MRKKVKAVRKFKKWKPGGPGRPPASYLNGKDEKIPLPKIAKRMTKRVSIPVLIAEIDTIITGLEGLLKEMGGKICRKD